MEKWYTVQKFYDNGEIIAEILPKELFDFREDYKQVELNKNLFY